MDDIEEDLLNAIKHNPEKNELAPAEIVSATVKGSPETSLWLQTLDGEGPIYKNYWWPHLRYLWGFWAFPKDYPVRKSFPRLVWWLTFTTVLNWFLSFSWLIIMILTIISGNFNVEMKFTTDFLTAAVYPVANNSVGNVKFGWFYMAMFLWQFVVLSVLLLNKRLFYNWIRHQLSFRYDFWRFLIHVFTMPILALTICGMVGITNVFLIIAIVMFTMFYWFFTHFAPEYHISNLYFVLLSLHPRYDTVEGRVEARDQTLMDGEIDTLANTIVNGGINGAIVSPLTISKVVAHQLLKGRELTEEEKAAYFEENENVTPDETTDLDFHLWNIYNTGNVIAHWFDSATHFIFTIPISGWLLMILLAPIAYFGGAVGSNTSTFHWWVITAFWIFFVAMCLDLIWTLWYWSLKWNQREVVHKPSSFGDQRVSTVKLLITSFHYTMTSLTFWTLTQIFISFLLLGGAWAMPGNLLF